MRTVKLTILTLFFIPVAIAARDFYGDWRGGDVYARVVKGESETSIIKRLGKPDTVERCGEFLWWQGDMINPPRNNGLCVKWARYNYFLSAWAFGYSANGKLVSRYHYVSE